MTKAPGGIPPHRLRSATAVFLAGLLLAGGPVRGQDGPPESPAAATPAADPPAADGPAVPYTVELTGVEDGDLAQALRDTSTLIGLKDDPPPSLLGLERRASEDRERLQQALRSAGYYDARLDIGIDDSASPPAVTVAVREGPAYTFGTVTIAPTGAASGGELPGGAVSGADLGLVAGQRARAPEVVAAQNRLIDRLRAHGYGFARVADRRVVVDHGDRTMDVTYTVDTGPLVRFGEARIQGLKDVDATLIRNRLPWARGDVFDPTRLEEARQDIAALGTFSLTRLTLADEPGPDGVTPVVVTVEERLPRFIGFGVGYSTSEGVGANAYWGHRNLFGGGEQFRIEAEVARLAGGDSSASGLDQIDLKLGVNFRKPDFLAPKQSLVLGFNVVTDNPPAYEREAAELTAALERPLGDGLTLSYGAAWEVARIDTNTATYDTTLLGVPLALTYDGTDDLLNPTRGIRATVNVTPWQPFGDEASDPFVVTRLITSAYHDFSDGGGLVLAGRLGLGSIAGSGLGNIPPDKRFYAGGGGSVRGYGFQLVGPRDAQGDPTGGRALFETGVELRIKVTDTIGVVPFLDAGAVYDRAFPDLSEPLKFGAGLGLRYYTDFGPLRVDVGVPLNKEPGDDSWQLYLSLGQAF